jgi:hypothetical protein
MTGAAAEADMAAGPSKFVGTRACPEPDLADAYSRLERWNRTVMKTICVHRLEFPTHRSFSAHALAHQPRHG